MGRLENRVAVITGAASGIGEGMVDRFVAEGASVVVADLQVEAGTSVAERHGDVAVFSQTDVTSEADVSGAVDLAVSTFGRLDIMVNNAGIIGAVGPIASITEDAWDTTVDILLKGVFLGMKHAARVMVPQGSGVVLSTTSIAGIVGGLGPHVYTAAKHGVVGLTKSVANELGPDGIRVNCIAPGNTVTAMTAKSTTGDATEVGAADQHIAAGSLLGYAGFPEDIANAALYLASDDARYVTGHCLVVDGGHTSAGRARARFNAAAPDIVR